VVDFIEPLWKDYGYLIEGIWADDFGIARMIVNTLRDELRKRNIFIPTDPAPKYNDGGRKERKTMMDLLIGQKRIWFIDRESYKHHKLLVYSKKEIGFIEDRNLIENDYYDSGTYSWLYKIEEIRGAKYGIVR